MVQRIPDAVVRHDAAPGELRATVTATRRKVKRRRRDAMTEIKARMLRCSRAKADRGRFKRGYLPTGCGTAIDSAVFLYLACVVCTARPSASSVSIGVQELK